LDGNKKNCVKVKLQLQKRMNSSMPKLELDASIGPSTPRLASQ
jgi:hypothetical protein